MGPQVPALIANGTPAADVPADFGYVTDAAQKKAQERLAALVPGARHITKSNSGHDIHNEQPRLVTQAIVDVRISTLASISRHSLNVPQFGIRPSVGRPHDHHRSL